MFKVWVMVELLDSEEEEETKGRGMTRSWLRSWTSFCPLLLAIFDSFLCLLDRFSPLRIHFVKRKKHMTERTVYSNRPRTFKRSSLIEIDIFLSKMLVQHVGCARKRIQYHPT